MTSIMRCLRCWFGHHDYTFAAEQGIVPTQEQLSDPGWGFWDYAKFYCRNCGHESSLSLEMRAKHPRRIATDER